MGNEEEEPNVWWTGGGFAAAVHGLARRESELGPPMGEHPRCESELSGGRTPLGGDGALSDARGETVGPSARLLCARPPGEDAAAPPPPRGAAPSSLAILILSPHFLLWRGRTGAHVAL
ncbi:hypothetical protein Zm00014a_001049 [Zea mays]|uniref:Uncharacterized protein n=2 Tax=Zea mays TaxID=4577 RepID=A0A317YL87_MAIZE|nr:hypothetical protein Zm00014a_001049 [Zea mays]